MLSTGYQWVPRDDWNASAQTRVGSDTDLESCVTASSEQLAAVREQGYRTPTPSRERRVLELLECMKLKGWQFEYNKLLDEIAITNR
jgi:hypothetical protein